MNCRKTRVESSWSKCRLLISCIGILPMLCLIRDSKGNIFPQMGNTCDLTTFLSAETGGIVITPRPSPDDTPPKPSFPTRPFWGILPELINPAVSVGLYPSCALFSCVKVIRVALKDVLFPCQGEMGGRILWPTRPTKFEFNYATQ